MPSVADALVGRVRDAGVRAMFGVPGGGSSLDIIAADAELDHALKASAGGRGPTLIDARIDPAPYGDLIRTIRG